MTSAEDEPSSTNSTSTVFSDTATSLDGSVQTEGLLDSLLAGVPVVGPLLNTLLDTLLDTLLGSDTSSTASAVGVESITPEQSAALAELLLRLFEEFQGLNSTQSA